MVRVSAKDFRCNTWRCTHASVGLGIVMCTGRPTLCPGGCGILRLYRFVLGKVVVVPVNVSDGMSTHGRGSRKVIVSEPIGLIFPGKNSV